MDEFRNKSDPANKNRPPLEAETDEKSKVEKLVTRSIDGNSDAFGELYILHVERIYRYVFYHVKSKTFAEDVTEDVFIKAWRAIGSCRGRERTFSSWLYRIAHNQMIDQLHKSNRHPAQEIEDIDNVSDTTSRVEIYLEQRELLTAIDRLPPNQRQVIILKFIEGFDNRDIARIMNKNEGAIRVLQMRALATLKKVLNKE